MPMMSSGVKLSGLVFVLMVAFWSPAHAFGWLGHRLAGEVAEEYLCAEAKVQLQQLNPSYDFASAGNWADKVRYSDEWRYTRFFHYMNVNGNVFNANTPRSSNGDVLSAIYKYRDKLASPDSNYAQKQSAMLFLVHFVVDVHQPLHVGYSRDLGGNKVPVLLDGRTTNLHSVWDTALLQSEDQSIQDYTDSLLAIAADQADVWQADSPEVWVQESIDVRSAAYRYPTPRSGGKVRLSDAYMLESKELIDIRLAQAGVRLAGELNAIWCPADAVEP
jgi:hypothetical protein